MGLLAPLGLLGLAAAVPIVALYLLRSRRQRVTVPSTLLWEGQTESVTAARPWQRLTIVALLLVQLAIVVLLALVLARPSTAAEGLLAPHTVLVVDTSGSMSAGSPARLDAALDVARDLAADVDETRAISIVVAGPRPEIVLTLATDPGRVAEVLDSISPSGAADTLPEALTLAAGLESTERATRVVVLSDGGRPADAGGIGATLPAGMVFHGVGETVPNIAIRGFRLTPRVGTQADLFVEVANHGVDAAEVTIEVRVDGGLAHARTVGIEAGGAASVTEALTVAPGAVVEARADGGDVLPLDDAAWAIVAGEDSLPYLLTGTGSVFLDAFLGSVPGAAVLDGPGAPAFAVYDRTAVPAELPAGAIVFAATVPPVGVTITGEIDRPIISFVRPDDARTASVDLADTAILRAQAVEAPGWLPLVSSPDGPLVLLGDVAGKPVAYFTFDIHDSNLPLQPAFPVLMQNLVGWLTGGGTRGEARPAGQPVPLRPPEGTTAIVVTGPDGVAHDVPPGAIEYAATDLPGVYEIEYTGAEGVLGTPRAAVNFAAGDESVLVTRAPADGPALAGGAGTVALSRVWSWLLLAGVLALLALEWWLSFGRPRPSRRKADRPPAAGAGRERPEGRAA